MNSEKKINYSDSLSAGVQRTKEILFTKPFNFVKWLCIGFTAWIAQFGDNFSFPNMSRSFSGRKRRVNTDSFFDEKSFFEIPDRISQWIHNNTLLFLFIILGVLLLMGFIVLFIWLSSRGKLMFLDNVFKNRGLVKETWKDSAKTGDSLFVWRLAFFLICFAVVIILIAGFLYALFKSSAGKGPNIFMFICLGVFILMVFILTFSIVFIKHLLNSYIVPVMYRDNCTATEAWRKFLPVFRANFFKFFVFALILFFIDMGIGILVFSVSVMTCCVGFIVLAIPFAGTVILLPVEIFKRTATLDFLARLDLGPGLKSSE